MYTIKNKALYINTNVNIQYIDIYKIALFLSSSEIQLSMHSINILQKIPFEEIQIEEIKKLLIKALDEKYPYRFFQCLKVLNILNHFFPEISHLIGVPQKNAYGFKYDCFDHTVNCMKQTLKHNPTKYSMWAALVHDLGKGITDRDTLPNHYGHDKRGIILAQKLADRFKLDLNFQIAGFLATSMHMKAHKIMIIRPGKLISLLNEINKFPGGISQYFAFLKGDGARNIDLSFALAMYSFIRNIEKKYERDKLCQQVSFEKQRIQSYRGMKWN